VRKAAKRYAVQASDTTMNRKEIELASKKIENRM
jgi:hypothetical protein